LAAKLARRMWLIEGYLPIKTTHVTLVLISGSLFAVRGFSLLCGAQWPLKRWLRISSQLIDSALLIAALLLLAALQINPFAQPWLCAKLALLLAYIGLGILALRRRKWLAFVLALGCFAMMLSVAKTHHPLGFFAFLSA